MDREARVVQEVRVVQEAPVDLAVAKQQNQLKIHQVPNKSR